MTLEIVNIPVEERDTFLESLLSELSIGHLAKQKAFSLSGGHYDPLA